MLIAFAADSDGGAGGTGAVYVAAPTGWTIITNTKASDSNVTHGGEVLTHTYTAGESVTFSSVGTNAGDSTVEITVVAVRGVTAVDVTKGSYVTTASTSWTMPSVSIAGTNRLLLGNTWGSTAMAASGFSGTPTILKSNQKGTGAKYYSSVAAWSNPATGSTAYTATFTTASTGWRTLVAVR